MILDDAKQVVADHYEQRRTLASQNVLYRASAPAPNAPKELGYLQRVEGVVRGLAEIEEQLIGFTARVQGNDGHPVPGNPAGTSLSDSLASAEQRIRNILQTINGLNEAF